MHEFGTRAILHSDGDLRRILAQLVETAKRHPLGHSKPVALGNDRREVRKVVVDKAAVA